MITCLAVILQHFDLDGLTISTGCGGHAKATVLCPRLIIANECTLAYRPRYVFAPLTTDLPFIKHCRLAMLQYYTLWWMSFVLIGKKPYFGQIRFRMRVTERKNRALRQCFCFLKSYWNFKAKGSIECIGAEGSIECIGVSQVNSIRSNMKIYSLDCHTNHFLVSVFQRFFLTSYQYMHRK